MKCKAFLELRVLLFYLFIALVLKTKFYQYTAMFRDQIANCYTDQY